MPGSEASGAPPPPKSQEQGRNRTTTTENDVETRTRSSTQSSGRLRSTSLKFLESSPPSGMWHATGNVLAQAPTPMEIRRGDFGHSGWDGELQRRNSNITEESSGRLSKQSSAQTPGSLVRTKTNPMEAHPEAEDEGEATRPPGEQKTQQATSSTDQQVPAPASRAPEGEDDPFDLFVGRGRIQSQVYEPTKKTTTRSVELEEDLKGEDSDDADSLDDLDPRPKKRLSALPKKFLDPAGDSVPKPDEDPRENTKVQSLSRAPTHGEPDADGVYPTGYKFPPKHTWGEATVIGLKAFWKFTITPLGFLIVLYGLNVVAWGGMLFLLLIGGGDQFMCYPHDKPPGYKDCNDLNSPRRIWIEIDSQILNALFCVTGFGLIPWRFRDLYYLLQFRIRRKQYALRRLAGIHRAWFRLPGSHKLPAMPGAISNTDTNEAIAMPASKNPDPPLTGFRAPDTKLWKLDYVIWAYVLNTFLQAVLSGFMWGLNRFDRPSWSTGTFVALACIVAGLGGLMCFLEGKRVKAVEGISVTAEEVLADVEKQVVDNEEKGEPEKRRRKRLSKSNPLDDQAT